MVAADKNVVAHWSFDDENAESVSDLSGNDFVGIVKNQVPSENGVLGRAMEFNPESNSCVVIGRGLGEIGRQLSVEIIFKAAIPQENAHLLNAALGKEGFRVLVTRKKILAWQVPDPNASEVWSNACLSSVPIRDGQWYHMVGTYDGTSLRIFLNGEETGHLAIASPYDVRTTRKPVLGSFDEKGVEGGFRGLLDEVKIYNRCLQPEEIQSKWKALSDEIGKVSQP
jgi:hypothetical protein